MPTPTRVATAFFLVVCIGWIASSELSTHQAVETSGRVVHARGDEWHGLENHGRSPVAVMGVFSAPGYHSYFAATSVPAGQAVVPFSPSELREVRERFKNVIVFKEP